MQNHLQIGTVGLGRILVVHSLVNVLDYVLEGFQGLDYQFVPVVITKVNNNGNDNRKGDVFEVLEDVNEKLVFEVAHCSVSHLQMRRGHASDYSLEDVFNQRL
jgi:hypothetical protein